MYLHMARWFSHLTRGAWQRDAQSALADGTAKKPRTGEHGSAVPSPAVDTQTMVANVDAGGLGGLVAYASDSSSDDDAAGAAVAAVPDPPVAMQRTTAPDECGATTPSDPAVGAGAADGAAVVDDTRLGVIADASAGARAQSTELCRNFLKGRCRRGSSCHYVHDKEQAELRAQVRVGGWVGGTES